MNKTIKNKSSNKKIINTGIIIRPSKINNKLYINNKTMTVAKDIYDIIKLLLEKKKNKPKNKIDLQERKKLMHQQHINESQEKYQLMIFMKNHMNNNKYHYYLNHTTSINIIY